ncbi:tRNA lysidine(34) synthetase TilS [Streptomyces sp. NBC_00669]|uniref:tRNA lysidine(34) synthetase TilS n=1 Tax=unclassified Streptomyces TaxID=2593676 RepID=UPI002E2242ED|nr:MULTISPECIES: tRNA lysidine(34) synthetase TilS [unclassified Streptomyces]
MGPHPTVAAIRLAVRRVLHDVLAASADASAAPSTATAGAAGPLVLAACSGGADSMALAAALAFEAPRLGMRAGAVTVDHGLQSGSARRAQEVVERLRALGLDPVDAIGVTVGRQSTTAAHGGAYVGTAGTGTGRRVGPEAAARDARYAALDTVAERRGAAAVLLGHTRDDQAETVLLGLARGSGTRSLSGMAAVSGTGGRYRRPFLLLDRDTVRQGCLAQGITVWEDPHNHDPAYTRSRVRHEALPVLEKSLGKGVVQALARTAQLSRDDADALDQWAADAQADVAGDDGSLDVARLHRLPAAVRRRVLRRAAVAAGSPPGFLFARHIEEVDRLVTGWRGQKALNLPGGVAVRRADGRLVFSPS